MTGRRVLACLVGAALGASGCTLLFDPERLRPRPDGGSDALDGGTVTDGGVAPDGGLVPDGGVPDAGPRPYIGPARLDFVVVTGGGLQVVAPVGGGFGFRGSVSAPAFTLRVDAGHGASTAPLFSP